MNFDLSWDLFFLVILALVFLYNFLIGQRGTIKMIVSTYMGILTADGLANLVRDFIVEPSQFLSSMIVVDGNFYIFLRIFLFIFVLLLFVLKAGFHIHLVSHDHWFVRIFIHGLFSLVSSMILISSLLFFFSGNSFLNGLAHLKTVSQFDSSFMVDLFLRYFKIWFTLPALGFLIASFAFGKSTKKILSED